MLNHKKSQSILQWFNSLTSRGNVNSLQQFSDGIHFFEIVSSLQSFFTQESKEDKSASESVIFSDTDISCAEQVISSVVETEEKTKTSVSKSVNADPFVIKESDLTDTQKRYDSIKKFIDGFYSVESSSLIDFKECQKGKDLELAKVAVFLLSAMVQSLLSTEDKVVYNTTLLEPEVQENIRECLSLVLVDKDSGENPIKKTELHRVLSRAATFKGTPVRKQPSRSTSDPYEFSDNIKSIPKKRREKTNFNESLQDSPLKNLLESPKIQYKAAIFKKDSDLAKLRGALLNEENKVMDLTSEKENLNEELKKRKKDLEFYKKELEVQREALCEKEEQANLKIEELKNKKIEEERLKKHIEEQEEEIKQLKENNDALHKDVDNIKKTLEQEKVTTASIANENSSLKEKILALELDNEKKDETIKILNEKVTHIEKELKTYQQIQAELAAGSGSRKELRSPNESETLSTIIYADKKSSRETMDEVDTKDDRIKRLTPQQKSLQVESLEQINDRLRDSVQNLQNEKTALEEELERYKSKHASETSTEVMILRKIECESALVSLDTSSLSYEAGIAAVYTPEQMQNIYDEFCEIWSSLADHYGFPKLEKFCNPADYIKAKISFETAAIVLILKELKKKSYFSSIALKKFEDDYTKRKLHLKVPYFLRDLFLALLLMPDASVTTQSRSLTIEEVGADSLNKASNNLEEELSTLKRNMKILKIILTKKDEELKIAHKNFEESKTCSMKDVESLRQELAISQEKYKNMEQLVKKKDDDVKKALLMYQKLVKHDKKNNEGNKDYDKVLKRAKELYKECEEANAEIVKLHNRKKYQDRLYVQAKEEIENLKTQVQELKRKLWLETSGLSKNMAERNAVISQYFAESKHEPFEKLKNLELKQKERKRLLAEKEQKKSSQHIFKSDSCIDDERSMWINRSIRNSFFQMADEDDFVNQSSLADIHNGGEQEDESGIDRLQEIRRRNTLCPPHLQSCYPLEIEAMTPSQKKYYDAEEVPINHRTSVYQQKADPRKKPKSRCIESDSEDSDASHSLPAKKPKLAKTDSVSLHASKRPCQPSSSLAKTKPSTPLKRVAAFVRRQSSHKTPISVQRLISIPRKRKGD